MQFSIAPVIYHFLICYMSFANLKNFSFLILYLYSRNPSFSCFSHCIRKSSLIMIEEASYHC
jgi:hypothetical protein